MIETIPQPKSPEEAAAEHAAQVEAIIADAQARHAGRPTEPDVEGIAGILRMNPEEVNKLLALRNSREAA